MSSKRRLRTTKPRMATSNIQTDSPRITSMSIQTDPESVPAPILTVEMETQTDIPEPEPEDPLDGVLVVFEEREGPCVLRIML